MGQLLMTLKKAMIHGIAFGASMLWSIAFAGIGSAADFYAGKTLTIVTSMGGGGTNDIIARMIARTMPQYLAGKPTIIVKNMPGAGNMLATNYMYSIAPKDGSEIAVVNNAIPLNEVLGNTGVRYKSLEFNWLGSPVKSYTSLIILASSGIQSANDLFTKQVILGGIGAGSSNVIWPTAINRVLGTKFKVVAGYNSGPALWLAMARGEIEGRTGSYKDLYSQHPEWIKEKKVLFPVQLGSTPDPELPSVPNIETFVKNEEQQKILKLVFSPIELGQPYLAPPGVPKERVATLRAAFSSTLKDDAFLKSALERKFDIDPISAEDITRSVTDAFGASPQIVAKTKVALTVAREKE